jgi:hypothetical protein
MRKITRLIIPDTFVGHLLPELREALLVISTEH